MRRTLVEVLRGWVPGVPGVLEEWEYFKPVSIYIYKTKSNSLYLIRKRKLGSITWINNFKKVIEDNEVIQNNRGGTRKFRRNFDGWGH